jgi:hypothetical protein
VTNNRTVVVCEWSESGARIISKPRVHSFWPPPGIAGLAGTLALHLVVLVAVVQAHRIPAPVAPKPVERLVFIDLPTEAKANAGGVQALAGLNVSPIKVDRLDPPWPTVEIESLAFDEDKQLESSASSADATERARLAGIYSRQIQARVERVWNRPRTPVSDGSNATNAPDTVEYFHCLAQIVQDSTGNVQEILLPNCNGSAAWQHSLVVAIQQASPLPAPPSPTVFSRAITLNFVGYPYVAGESDEGYEKAALETAQVTSPAKTPEDISREFSSFRSLGRERTQ